ncbi:pilus assembly protein PilY [Glaciecola sp. MH2013]|uniref:VWA domain-containing protein n=1 Tax=Glaciecola sp. MH2013 TaxID=2785524 RepID=UPI0018A10847|nr:VWA domain-containing protein [Glaciecola sp. MH2013]MBF7074743.1 pilus assembly protein PilY [Glaciecola sp. MH2013]
MKIKKIVNSFSAFALTMLVSMSAMGDDLEIYLGTGSTSSTYNPNVLFIMDTSGSMGEKDGTSQTRMLRVQNALKDTLRSATNINAGLMRFSDYGGPILFPVRDIDSPVAPELILPITSSQNDATEIDEEVNLTSNQLELTKGTEEVFTGLRYEEVRIPRGAVITGAYLRFTSTNMNTSQAEITIKAEAVGNSTAFLAQDDNISDRSTTGAAVIWETDNDFPLAEETVNTPDLSAVIQEVVNRGDWCGGNALSMIIRGESNVTASNRTAASLDAGTGRTPQLIITYDESTATGCMRERLIYQIESQGENAEERWDGNESTGTELTFDSANNRFVGLRFQGVNVPQNAVILDAYLEFTAHNTYNESGARMTIQGVNEDHPNDFNPYVRYMQRDKSKTAPVSWDNIPTWSANNDYRSPSIKTIVQTIVNRSGWRNGNKMMFIMSEFTGAKRGGYTVNGKPSGAARLIIDFEGNATPGASSTVRQHLMGKVDELSPNGYTPIVDTLYEAANYFGGNEVLYGLKRGLDDVNWRVRASTRVSHRASYIGANAVRPEGCDADNLSDPDCIQEYIPDGAEYISPVVDLQCQVNNHIVLLSDGIANNNHSVDEIQAMLGTSCSGSGGEKCGVDLVTNISDSDDSVIDARVVTHTIGFAANSTANSFLNQLALQSGGGFYQADNSEDLVQAFQTILRSVKDVNATFVSPGVAVNQLNRLTHRDELYFALFKPSEGALWPGNLKKYKISGDTVLDRNNMNAVDGSTGFFSENSQSYWSTTTDGNDVREGGAASRLDLVRRVYFFDGEGSVITAANELNENNTNILDVDLNLDSTSDPAGTRELILKWARGVDVRDDDGDGSTEDVRLQMGDPIHSQPVIVNYSATDSAVFVATNHGFLHSIDAETGEENFAIMPKSLMGNLNEFYRNASSFNHIYGIDGDMVYREYEGKKYIYIGMRRGGTNYYVVDVTSKLDPKIVFTIEGGQGDYFNLGQTWSRPTITKVKIGDVIKNVMIIGAGYDDDQDDKAERSADTVGNSVYIIDADNGDLLWSASNSNTADLNLPDMQYSIPARIAVIDRDNDSLADHMYVADTGGQIFRLDIYNGEPVNKLVSGGLLAQTGGDEPENNRRFYYAPDVSEISTVNEHYYAVAIGSGFRAGPLNTTINDNFYMIKDDGVFVRDSANKFTLPSTPLQLSDLYDATEHLLTSDNEEERAIQNTLFSSKSGWMIRLTSGGEKVLASPLILDYQIFFTTYLPSSASTSACAPPTGNSRAYLVNLVDGNAVEDLNDNDQQDATDRYAQLKQTGIAPDTKILIENIVSPVVCLGAECVSAVIETDENGDIRPCGSDFECLARNIYGRFERVQKNTWKTEVERQ